MIVSGVANGILGTLGHFRRNIVRGEEEEGSLGRLAAGLGMWGWKGQGRSWDDSFLRSRERGAGSRESGVRGRRGQGTKKGPSRELVFRRRALWIRDGAAGCRGVGLVGYPDVEGQYTRSEDICTVLFLVVAFVFWGASEGGLYTMKCGVRGAGGGMVFISCWEARRRNFRGGQKKRLWDEMDFATR